MNLNIEAATKDYVAGKISRKVKQVIKTETERVCAEMKRKIQQQNVKISKKWYKNNRKQMMEIMSESQFVGIIKNAVQVNVNGETLTIEYKKIDMKKLDALDAHLIQQFLDFCEKEFEEYINKSFT